jgi:Raf kinase inhibitor-like YbhB/YbcL family protein
MSAPNLKDSTSIPAPRKRLLVLLALSVLALMGCSGTGEGEPEMMAPSGTSSDIDLSSPAFEDEGMIPQTYTCDGQDISPELRWSDPPERTQSFVLIVEDPDAPARTWIHWVIYNIPADQRSLEEAVPPEAELPNGALQGQNSWPRTGYGGPCPPRGTHRYFFTLYALDTTLGLDPQSADKAAVLESMEGHVLAQTSLMGQYERQR